MANFRRNWRKYKSQDFRRKVLARLPTRRVRQALAPITSIHEYGVRKSVCFFINVGVVSLQQPIWFGTHFPGIAQNSPTGSSYAPVLVNSQVAVWLNQFQSACIRSVKVTPVLTSGFTGYLNSLVYRGQVNWNSVPDAPQTAGLNTSQIRNIVNESLDSNQFVQTFDGGNRSVTRRSNIPYNALYAIQGKAIPNG